MPRENSLAKKATSAKKAGETPGTAPTVTLVGRVGAKCVRIPAIRVRSAPATASQTQPVVANELIRSAGDSSNPEHAAAGASGGRDDRRDKLLASDRAGRLDDDGFALPDPADHPPRWAMPDWPFARDTDRRAVALLLLDA